MIIIERRLREGKSGSETAPAPGFVFVGAADFDPFLSGADPLVAVGGVAADDADGEILGHIFGDGEQFRHRLEGNSTEILVETRYDNTAAAVGEVLADTENVIGKKLCFVDADDIGVGPDLFEDFSCGLHRLGEKFRLVVGNDILLRVPLVERVLEDLYFLSGDGRESDAADQFLGFAREHTAANDFNPSCSSWPLVHRML